MKPGLLLPSASEGWREVMFSQACVCSTFVKGYPHLGGGGMLIRPWWGVAPSSLMGYPIHPARGVSCPPCRGGGVPHPPWWRVPPSFLRGYPRIPPIRRLDGSTPLSGDWMGVPSLSGDWMGVPPVRRLDGGTPPPPHQGIEQQSEHLLRSGQ